MTNKSDLTTTLTALTAKQRRFVQEYIIDSNGTQAALRAGYARRTARSTASTLLTKPNVKQYLALLQADLEAKSKLSAEQILERITSIADNPKERTENRLRALELLGKNKAMWTDKVIERHDTSRDKLDRELLSLLSAIPIDNKPENAKNQGDISPNLDNYSH